jgi:CheY-like chemotaxis protein
MNRAQMTILLVESDPVERERLAEVLEREGFVVIACVGPSDPDYTCIGGREGYCPLPEQADAVVLDFCLAGDEFELGTSSEQLLDMYLGMGRSVVTIGPGTWSTSPHGVAEVHRLGAHPDETDLITAVRNLPASEGFVFHSPPMT